MNFQIGIIGAMDAELFDLISRLEEHSTENVSGITFNVGVLSGKRVVIAKCGIGKVFAAATPINDCCRCGGNCEGCYDKYKDENKS